MTAGPPPVHARPPRSTVVAPACAGAPGAATVTAAVHNASEGSIALDEQVLRAECF